VRADGDNGTGLTMFSRYPLERPESLAIGTIVQHAITAGVNVDGRVLTLVAAHPWPPISPAKAVERDRYLARIVSLVRSIDGPVLVAGDLNTTPWSHVFTDFVAAANLTGREPVATWPAPLGRFGIPIDHILGRRVAIDSTTVGPSLGSDHRPIIAEISF
jgi:endonuclease/exonuclease/phosphatase (EEP) superfamily protein YafD